MYLNLGVGAGFKGSSKVVTMHMLPGFVSSTHYR